MCDEMRKMANLSCLKFLVILLIIGYIVFDFWRNFHFILNFQARGLGGQSKGKNETREFENRITVYLYLTVVIKNTSAFLIFTTFLSENHDPTCEVNITFLLSIFTFKISLNSHLHCTKNCV